MDELIAMNPFFYGNPVRLDQLYRPRERITSIKWVDFHYHQIENQE